MRDPFANYDAWLEAPYQQMMAEADAFYEWCEANDVDSENPEAEDLYMEWIESQYEEYEEYDEYEEFDEWSI